MNRSSAVGAVLPAIVLATVSTGCPLEEDIPGFGRSCAVDRPCDAGYLCDAEQAICVPDTQIIEVFRVEPADVRPGESVTFTIAAPGAASCAIDNGVGVAVVDGTQTAPAPVAPGDHTFTLTCRSGDGGSQSVALDPPLHVRRVHFGDLVLEDDRTVRIIDAVEQVEEITGHLRCASAAVTDDSIRALAGVRMIGGDLHFVGCSAVESLTLPALTTLGGALVVDAGLFEPEVMRAIELPALRTIGASAALTLDMLLELADTDFTEPDNPESAGLVVRGYEDESNGGIERILLPALQSIAGSVVLGGYAYPSPSLVMPYGLGALQELDLASLQTVGGSFDIEAVAGPADLALPALQTVGGMFATFDLGARTVRLPDLQRAGGILFASNENLTRIDLPQLEELVLPPDNDVQTKIYQWTYGDDPLFAYAPGSFSINANNPERTAYSNAGIETVDLHSLQRVAGILRIHQSLVAFIDLDRLQTARGVQINGNEVQVTQPLRLAALEAVGDLGLFVYEPRGRVEGLQRLATVGGDFAVGVDPDPATKPVFPALTTIGGDLILNPSYGYPTVAFSALTRLGSLTIDGAEGPTLPDLPMPSGALVVRDTPALTALSLTAPDGGHTASVTVEDNAALQTVSLTAATLGTTTFRRNPQLQGITLSTTTTTRDLTIEGTIGGSLTGVSACALETVEDLTLRQTSLTSLDGLAGLTMAVSLTFTTNRALPDCAVAALRQQTATTAGTDDGAGPDEPASCTLAVDRCGI